MIVTITQDAVGRRLFDWLVSRGHYIIAPCGGRGTCGKCRVKLLGGLFCDVVTNEIATPDESGYILSCQVYCTVDSVGARISLPSAKGEGLVDFETTHIAKGEGGYAISLDVGTTTIGACLVDKSSGEIISKTSMLNPQAVYGADVLSRIQACSEGKLEHLQSLVLDATKEIISTLATDKHIDELCVSANTTMLHLYIGVDPATIGRYPFSPVFVEEKVLSGESLGLEVDVVRLLPSASAYIGSDVTVGVLACDMRVDSTQLLVDMGTNGEIVLSHGGRLYATSTAVGPALEGASIECGVGGVVGAIDRVRIVDGEIIPHTIGDATPIGICGSGLVQLTASLLRLGMIDETGAWSIESDSPLYKYFRGDRLYLTDDIYLSQKDVRQLQLAKSALCSGIETLLIENDVNMDEVNTVYIAGGVGYYIDLDSASEIGLLPQKLKKVAKVVGNTSLAGNVNCVLSSEDREKVAKISREIKVIDLSFSNTFVDKYMENMYFAEGV